MRPRVVVLQLASAASSAAIAGSQTPGSAGKLTLTATPFTMPNSVARRVSITSAGNDSAHTFTITGTDRNSNPQSEVVTGPNATTVQSANDYLTVSSIAISAAATGAITSGTGATGSSQWIVLDHYERPQISIACVVSGTITYSIETTLDNILTNQTPPYNVFNSTDTNVVNATTSQQSNFAYRPFATRVTATAGQGKVTVTVMETGPLSV